MRGFTQAVTICAAGMFLCAGGYCTIRLKGVQLRRLGAAFRQIFKRDSGEEGRGISSFEACAVSLAAALGTGNITGVASAILLGGPGAVFWMWVSAFLGMASKYAEICLAVKYRGNSPCGWLQSAGRHGRTLCMLFCLFGGTAALGVGAMVQSSALAQAVLEPAGGGVLPRLFLGAGAAVITGFAVSGGAKGVGKLSAVLMPVMGGGYLLCALWVVGRHLSALPEVLGEIFSSALGLRAAGGGAWFAAVRYGVERGVFSNEAGLGSGALAHELSREQNPGTEGLWGIFEVFADTILMCSLTAFAILLTGKETAMQAFSGTLGMAGEVVVVGCSVLFALSSLFPWCIYGRSCIRKLTGSDAGWYPAVYCLCAAAAPLFPPEYLWQGAGILNACMAAPNLAGVIWHLRRGHVGGDA